MPLSPSLRARRAAVLRAARANPDNAPLLVAKHQKLLGAIWPLWIDRDVVSEQAEEQAWAKNLIAERVAGARELRRRALTQDFETMWTGAGAHLRARLDPFGPDAMDFMHEIALELTQLTCAVKRPDGSLQAIEAPFVPDPGLTLSDLWDTPIGHADGFVGPLGERLSAMEEGAVAETLRQELLTVARAQNGRVPADARDPDFDLVWKAAWHRLIGAEIGASPFLWMTLERRSEPLSRLLSAYGRGGAPRELIAAGLAINRIQEDIEIIGGAQKRQVFTDAGDSFLFHVHASGEYLEDDTEAPWMHLALRGGLMLALMNGGQLILDRYTSAMRENTAPVRETFAMALNQGEIAWLDANACRAVFSYSAQTGQAMPKEPGRLYRGFDGETRTVLR